MHLLLVGISHKTAPVELRERLDFQVRGIERALQALAARGSTREAVVLSTCNRAELYVACDDVTTTVADLVSFVSEFNAIDQPAVAPHVYDVADLEAARHLFRVAAGLDSLVVGEPQVLGQVKEAHTIAGEVHTVGPVLNRLFHSSFVVGKRVRTETGLGSGAVSIGYAAVALARKIFGDLKGRTRARRRRGRDGQADRAAHEVAGRAPRHDRQPHDGARGADGRGDRRRVGRAVGEISTRRSAASDIVITATGAAAPILTKARIEAVMRPRRNRPLFIIDIALPRDVEAAAGEIEQVFLYNIDDLQATVRENLARRASEVARAEAIVSEEVDKFGGWFRSRGAIPTVVALRQHFETIRRAELERLDFKLSSLPPEARSARRRDHPPHRREAAADTDRAAQVARRRRNGRRLHRSADAPVRPRRSQHRLTPDGEAPAGRSAGAGRVESVERRASNPSAGRDIAVPLVTARSFDSALAAVNWRCGRPRRRGADCRIGRSTVPHRRHQDVGRSAAGGAALRSRRQAAVRQGNRGCAPPARDRSRRAQQQGHAGAAARRTDDRRRVAARRSARRGGVAAQGRRLRTRVQHVEDLRSCRRSARRQRSARAACGASRSSRG